MCTFIRRWMTACWKGGVGDTVRQLSAAVWTNSKEHFKQWDRQNCAAGGQSVAWKYPLPKTVSLKLITAAAPVSVSGAYLSAVPWLRTWRCCGRCAWLIWPHTDCSFFQALWVCGDGKRRGKGQQVQQWWFYTTHKLNSTLTIAAQFRTLLLSATH